MRAKYTFNIKGQNKVIMRKGMNETIEHVVLKLLSYLLFNRRPGIEVSVRQHYKPDLLLEEESVIKVWIECGAVSPKKLDKISTRNNQAEIFVVKETREEAVEFCSFTEKKVRHPERMTFMGFEAGFVKEIANQLERVNRIDWTIKQNRIIINVNGEEHSSVIWNSRA